MVLDYIYFLSSSWLDQFLYYWDLPIVLTWNYGNIEKQTYVQSSNYINLHGVYTITKLVSL